jgi:hypothetical protein
MQQEPKPLVLFVSAGRTDLKLLASEQDRDCVVEIDRDYTRLFHDWLWHNPDRYLVEHENDAVELYKQPENKTRFKLNCQDGELGIFTDAETAANVELVTDEDERYIVVPVKLGRIVTQLKKDTRYDIKAVVIFNTHRDERAAKDEPFACGKLLAQWLAKCFALEFVETNEPALHTASWVDYLQDNERFDEEKQNAKAINRVVDALKGFAQDSSLHAAFCGIGGIPAFKNLIRSSGQFYFAERCLLADDLEDQNNPRITELKLQLTNEQSFTLRANVEKLLKAGDFLGAEAAVRHVQDTEHEQWLLPIRATANIFRGEVAMEIDRITNTALRNLLLRIQNTKSRCLLPALRTEAALQGGRYVEAINLTATFMDAALWDGIAQCLPRYGRVESLDDFEKEVEFSVRAIIPRDILVSPLELIIGHRYKINTMGSYIIDGQKSYNIDTWIRVINNDQLRGLNRLIRQVSDYRNTNTHGLLTPAQLMEAKTKFVDIGLWAEPPLYFLNQLRVIALVNDFGELAVNTLYSDLVRLLITNLQDFRWQENYQSFPLTAHS